MNEINNIERIAYTEILGILKKIEYQYSSKLPLGFITFLMENSIEDVKNEYTGFDENGEVKISPKAEEILDYINLMYWSTEDEKKELINIYTNNEKKINEKYNPDNLFIKNNKIKDEALSNVITTDLVEYRESLFIKLIKFIYRILHIT